MSFNRRETIYLLQNLNTKGLSMIDKTDNTIWYITIGL